MQLENNKRIVVLNIDKLSQVQALSNPSKGDRTWLTGVMYLSNMYNIEFIDYTEYVPSDNDIVIIPIFYAPWLVDLSMDDCDGIIPLLKEQLGSVLEREETYILFDNTHEGETIEFFEPMYRHLSGCGFDPRKVIYNTSSLSLNDDHDRYCEAHGKFKRMKVVGSSVWEGFDLYYEADKPVTKPTEYKNRSYKFLNLNRRLRSHRPAFVSMLCHRDLLKYGNVSLFDKDDGNATIEDAFVNSALYREYKNEIDNGYNKLKSKIPLIVDREDGTTNYAVDPDRSFLYTDSYFSLVSCTYYEARHQTVQMNEKIFKPIAYAQPFIIQGVPNTLKYLKEYGFKTFSQWINESYDEVEDDCLRAELILNEVERLSKFSNEQWDTMIGEMESVLLYNQNRLFDRTGKSLDYLDIKGSLEK